MTIGGLSTMGFGSNDGVGKGRAGSCAGGQMGLNSAGKIGEIRILISRERRVIWRIGSFQSSTNSPVREVVGVGGKGDNELFRVVGVIDSDCWEA